MHFLASVTFVALLVAFCSIHEGSAGNHGENGDEMTHNTTEPLSSLQESHSLNLNPNATRENPNLYKLAEFVKERLDCEDPIKISRFILEREALRVERASYLGQLKSPKNQLQIEELWEKLLNVDANLANVEKALLDAMRSNQEGSITEKDFENCQNGNETTHNTTEPLSLFQKIHALISKPNATQETPKLINAAKKFFDGWNHFLFNQNISKIDALGDEQESIQIKMLELLVQREELEKKHLNVEVDLAEAAIDHMAQAVFTVLVFITAVDPDHISDSWEHFSDALSSIPDVVAALDLMEEKLKSLGRISKYYEMSTLSEKVDALKKANLKVLKVAITLENKSNGYLLNNKDNFKKFQDSLMYKFR